jgi:hypothetical protein
VVAVPHNDSVSGVRAGRPQASATPRAKTGDPKASGAAIDQLREWYTATVSALLPERSPAEIRDATGLSTRYVITIRHCAVPHPRHYESLADLVGVELPGTFVRGPGPERISRPSTGVTRRLKFAGTCPSQ